MNERRDSESGECSSIGRYLPCITHSTFLDQIADSRFLDRMSVARQQVGGNEESDQQDPPAHSCHRAQNADTKTRRRAARGKRSLPACGIDHSPNDNDGDDRTPQQ